MAIGNGMVSPVIQYYSYVPFGLLNKLIDVPTANRMNATYQRCASAINSRNYASADQICPGIMSQVTQANPGINYYDIRKPCVGNLCYGFTEIANYLNKPDVQQKLNVIPPKKWASCNNTVGGRFHPVDYEESFMFDVPLVLAAKYQVLIYSGNKDLICNYLGGIEWMSAMQWPGQQSWLQATNTTWHSDGKIAGYAKNFENLTWLEVVDAGHMVPMDQPSYSLDLLQRFLNQKPFN